MIEGAMQKTGYSLGNGRDETILAFFDILNIEELHTNRSRLIV